MVHASSVESKFRNARIPGCKCPEEDSYVPGEEIILCIVYNISFNVNLDRIGLAQGCLMGRADKKEPVKDLYPGEGRKQEAADC